MFIAANKMILSTGSAMFLRNLTRPRYLIATNFEGEQEIFGNKIQISPDGTEEWLDFLVHDFGPLEQVTELGMWVRLGGRTDETKPAQLLVRPYTDDPASRPDEAPTE